MKRTLSIEQSARLIELGVDHPDAWINEITRDINGDKFPPRVEDHIFSLIHLLSILPKKITDRQRIYELRIWVNHYSDNWCIEYTHDTDVNDFDDSFVSAEELIDAVYQEICFLKTNNIKEL